MLAAHTAVGMMVVLVVTVVVVVVVVGKGGGSPVQLGAGSRRSAPVTQSSISGLATPPDLQPYTLKLIFSGVKVTSITADPQMLWKKKFRYRKIQ